MRVYLTARDPQGGEDVLFRMASQGVAPDREAYTVLLKTYVCVWGGEGIWTEEEG